MEEKLAQQHIHCILLFYWSTQWQNSESRARNLDPAPWWEKYQRTCGCHTPLPTSFHLKPRVLQSLNLMQPNHPPWELLKSYVPLSVLTSCVLRTQPRQIPSQMSKGQFFEELVLGYWSTFGHIKAGGTRFPSFWHSSHYLLASRSKKKRFFCFVLFVFLVSPCLKDVCLLTILFIVSDCFEIKIQQPVTRFMYFLREQELETLWRFSGF